MSNELYDELIAKGYLPELKFRSDAYTKLLYVKNLNEESVRVSNVGNFNVPTFPIANQNQTMKSISGGTRVHLGISDESEFWSCTGYVTNEVAFRYDNSELTREFQINVRSGPNSREFLCSGNGWLGGIFNSNPDFTNFLAAMDVSINYDSDDTTWFFNQNLNQAFQFEIISLNLPDHGISWETQPNTSIYGVDGSIVRFCLSQAVPYISCEGSTNQINIQTSLSQPVLIWANKTVSVYIGDQLLGSTTFAPPNSSSTNDMSIYAGRITDFFADNGMVWDAVTNSITNISVPQRQIRVTDAIGFLPPTGSSAFSFDGTESFSFCLDQAPSYFTCEGAISIATTGGIWGSPTMYVNDEPMGNINGIPDILDVDMSRETRWYWTNLSNENLRIRIEGGLLNDGDAGWNQNRNETMSVDFENNIVQFCLNTGCSASSVRYSATDVLVPNTTYQYSIEIEEGQSANEPILWTYVPVDPVGTPSIDASVVVDQFFEWFTWDSEATYLGIKLGVRDGGGLAWFQTQRNLPGSIWGADETVLLPGTKQPLTLVLYANSEELDPVRLVFGGNLTLHTCGPYEYMGS